MLRVALTGMALAMATAAHAEITFETYRGPATIEGTPQSVAVYDLAATDTLMALGIMPTGTVEQLGMVPYLADLKDSAAVVGSLFEPDLEALNALAPDLTIVGGRSSKKYEDVQRVGTTIDMTIWGDVVQQGYDRLDAYGAMFDKQAEADALRAKLEADFKATSELVAGSGKALIVMTNGPEVSAYGPNGRFGWLHDSLGIPAAADIEDSTHGETVSFEYIRDINPDILLVLDRLAAIGRDGDDAASVLDNALIQETNAWKNGKVIYLDSSSAYIAAGGVQAMHNVLASIRAGVE